MSTVRPVIAAVPNFNHGAALAEGGLVSSLLDSDYEQVVICDDASTQGLDELHELQSRFPGGVEVIQAQENGGAAAARNLVLQSSTLERVGSATIHFLDADVTPESSDNVARIHEIMHNRRLGAMGGLVLNESGIQVFLNYGPLITGPRRLLHAYGTGAVLTAVESLRARSPKQAEQWRGKLNFLLHDWPNTFSKPEPRPVGWVHEANMAIDSDLFRRIGGFDPSLRYHETQELSMQLKHLGLQRMFMPEVSVTQKAIDVRGKSRRLQEVSAALRLLMRYTLHTHPRYNRGHGETTEGPD